MLEHLTSELLESIGVDDRLEAALCFFVPAIAQGASIALDDGLGQARIRSAGHQSGVSVDIPLLNDEGRLGCLQLYFRESVDAPERSLLELLSTRIAKAMRHSLAFEREQRASFAFQYAALTTQLPRLPGYRVDAVYEAGRAEALIGGDWYDAFLLADGRLVLTIGDVVGSGLRAAVAMVSVRQSLRTVAQLHPDPALMLEAANRTLLEEFPDRFVTTFVALVDPVTQTCTYAGAGHPPPLLRLSDGSVVQLPTSGVPLGVGGFSENLCVNHVGISAGSMLVLYTDGVTEVHRRPIEGESALRDAVAALESGAAEPARRLYRTLLPSGARDDVAILTLCVQTPSEIPRWRFDPHWSDVTHRARLEITDVLVREGLDEACLFVFDVVFAEVVANLIRHAPGTAEMLLQIQADSVVLHVLDKGPGFQFVTRLPNDLFSEGGRGLFLISQLAGAFSVDRRPGGGSHARITIPKPKGAHA